MPGMGIGKLFDAGLVRKLIASHIGLNPKTQQQMLGKQIRSTWCRRARWSSASAPAASASAAC